MYSALTILFAFFLAAYCYENPYCNNVRRFVNGHNLRRMKLVQGRVTGQPAASEMKLMVWDDELAVKAAAWASRNEYTHNPDRTVPSGRYTTGENIYWFETTSLDDVFDPDQALDSWWQEHKLWTYGKLTAADFTPGTKEIGHYTQMAWSDSNRVGCAISKTFQNEWTKYFVVCNYGPGGNYIDQVPYPTGAPANKLTRYGNDCNRLYGLMCSSQ